MVGIVSVMNDDMRRDTGFQRQLPQKFMNKLGMERAYLAKDIPLGTQNAGDCLYLQ